MTLLHPLNYWYPQSFVGLNIFSIFVVQIDFLHCVISDKEYDIIVSCTSMNLFEEPKLPPDFRGNSSAPKDNMRLLVDKVNLNSQMITSRTITVLAVDINYALLELRNSVNEESPLAHVAVRASEPVPSISLYIFSHRNYTRYLRYQFDIHFDLTA